MDQDTRNIYVKEQQNNLQFIAPHLIPMHPNLGYVIEVNGVKIAQELFPEEYKTITEAMYQAFAKISKLKTDE